MARKVGKIKWWHSQRTWHRKDKVMAEIIEKQIETHKNIYLDTEEKRFISVRISVPSGGVNADTNMLILVCAYDANYEANIFTKLLKTLPDKYNLAVVCGYYFGAKFVDTKNLVITQDAGYHYKTGEETAEEFNDMGILQTLDVIHMTLAALDYIEKKAEELKHIILWGVSHGAYIAHLANLFCPDLYTYILDVSGYINPYFLTPNHNRKVRSQLVEEGPVVVIEIKDLISQRADLRYIPLVYNLPYLYKSSENNCKIMALQGKEDWMVNYIEKEIFIKDLGSKADILLFGEEDIDGELVKNASHALGIDFELFLNMTLPTVLKTHNFRKPLRKNEVILGKGYLNLIIDYSTGKPVWRPENNKWLESNQ